MSSCSWSAFVAVATTTCGRRRAPGRGTRGSCPFLCPLRRAGARPPRARRPPPGRARPAPPAARSPGARRASAPGAEHVGVHAASVWARRRSQDKSSLRARSFGRPLDGRRLPFARVLPSDPAGFRASRVMLHGAPSDGGATLVGPRDRHRPHNDPRRGSARRALIVALARAGRALVDDRLGGIEQRLDRRLGELDERVDRRLEGIDGRLLSTQQSTGETTTQIVERLTKLDGATEQMLQQASRSRGSSTSCARRRRAAASASCCSRTSCATGCRRRPTRSSTASRAASGRRGDQGREAHSRSTRSSRSTTSSGWWKPRTTRRGRSTRRRSRAT